jgi:hypothetical protein
MVGLNQKMVKRQLHAGILSAAGCSITTVGPKKGKCYSALRRDVALRKPRQLGLNQAVGRVLGTS